LAAKINPVFAVVTVFLWGAAVYGVRYRGRRPMPEGLSAAALLFPVIGAVLFFVSWPWLYHGAVANWPLNVLEYVVHMANHGVTGSRSATLYPLKCVLFMSPPGVLAAALAFFVLRRGHGEAFLVWLLLTIWTVLPVLRVSVPGAGFYDANRHFLEYIPGLCAMAGAGSAFGLDVLAEWRPAWRQITQPAALLVLATCLTWPIAQYHPFETSYVNALFGGLGVAQQRGLLHADPPLHRANGCEGDYWYDSLRDGLSAMRQRIRPGETLSACGPWPGQVLANWPYPEPIPYVGDERGHIEQATLSADLLYASPHEGGCTWQRIREFERTRPVLWRVTREGGLIYEIFGRSTGLRQAAISPRTYYDPSPAGDDAADKVPR
jgi:hypothetical protein